ncbi:MAG: YhcH/YjgK/YiaL family protein, partial [Anaeroplasmataceae bacterium]|nr:YhcH/YjgK/YiaL family protein [Anaeroplasmataceae bacterium]
MIVAKLRDIKRYKGISKNIDTAIDYILTHDLMALPKGKTIIDGDKVYVNRDTYVARPLEECFFENHEHYLDLQIVLKGQEIFGYTDIT